MFVLLNEIQTKVKVNDQKLKKNDELQSKKSHKKYVRSYENFGIANPKFVNDFIMDGIHHNHRSSTQNQQFKSDMELEIIQNNDNNINNNINDDEEINWDNLTKIEKN